MDDANAKLEVFIHQHLGQCVVKVERLEGGMVNHTFRLYLKDEFPSISTDSYPCDSLLNLLRQLKPKTLIVKMAFPYVATFGSIFPLPIARQKIEERALKLFNTPYFNTNGAKSTSTELHSVLDQNKTIKIARVWFLDETDNILIIEDLGLLSDIQQWLVPNEKSLLLEANIDQARVYGEQLGMFIADMQVSSLPYIQQLESLLQNPEFDQINFNEIVLAIEKTLNAYSVPNAKELCAIAIHHFKHNESRKATDGKVFSHCDLWAPSLLVDEHKQTLSVIDWECANVHSPAWDPAQLLSYFHILALAHPLNKHLRSFIYAFMDTYRETAKKNHANWYQNERDQHLFAWSLGVIHGTVLTYVSLWKKWCLCLDEKCFHQRSAIVLGADYLRRCHAGPEKVTYDLMSQDQFLGRLFQASVEESTQN